MVTTRNSTTPSKKREAKSPAQNSSTTKRSKNGFSAEKKQSTIEESMDLDMSTGNNEDQKATQESMDLETKKESTEDEKAVNETMKIAEDSIDDDSEIANEIGNEIGNEVNDKKPDDAPEKETGEKNAFDEVKADTDEVKQDVEKGQDSNTVEIAANTESIVEDPEREATIPSSILEKGIVYFFYRGRVGIEGPQSLSDIARSYLVLRPIPLGAQLGSGPLEDSGKARLLALPKKMIPKSTNDKFLMFTEKVGLSIKDIREEFASNEYATKTSGTSNTPAATPFAEGVYAITSTQGASHLAYILTKPSPLGEVQKEMGLHEKGSFVLSAKNPQQTGSVSIGNPAEYPEGLQKQFRGRGWMPLVPELLDYEHTQFLIIGEGLGEFDDATAEMAKDRKDDEKVKPKEEMELLEKEDHDRVENLKQDDPVFADLGLSSKEYLKISSSW